MAATSPATLLLPVGEVYRLFAFCGALYYGGIAFDVIGCPALVGEIVIGMALGPYAAKLFSAELVGALKIAGQAGLMLMVLEGGISMDADVLRSKGIRAVVLAATGTVLPVLLGWAVMLSLGHSSMCSLASGIALSSTAIGFTMRMMTDMSLLSTAEGQLITAAAMIDDVFSLILLSMLTVVQAESVDAWIFLRPLLASAVVTGLGFVGFRLVDRTAGSCGRLVGRLPPRIRAVANERAQETMLLVLVGFGVLAAWLSEGLYSTLLLGIFSVGACFCTVPLAKLSYEHVQPLQAWASRFFFGATVGFQVPVSDLFAGGNVGQGVVLLIPAILGKWASGAWGTSICNEGRFAGRVYWGTFNRVGCAMIGRGELGFQLATTSRAAGILTPEAYSATIWALLLATLLGPYAFRLSMRLTSCGLEGRGQDTTGSTATVTKHSPHEPDGDASRVENPAARA